MSRNLSISSLFISNQLGNSPMMSVGERQGLSIQKSRFNKFSVSVLNSKSLRPQIISKSEFSHFTTTALTFESVRTENGHDKTSFFEAFSCAALTISNCNFHDITNQDMNGACCFTYKQDMSYVKILSNTFTKLKNVQADQNGAFKIISGNEVTIDKNCFQECTTTTNGYAAFSISDIKSTMTASNNFITLCGQTNSNILGVLKPKDGADAKIEFSKNNITDCYIDTSGIIHVKANCKVSFTDSYIYQCENPLNSIVKCEKASTIKISKANFIEIASDIFYMLGTNTFDSINLINCHNVGPSTGTFTNCFSNTKDQKNFQYKADLTAQDLGIELICQPPPSKPDEKPEENTKPDEKPGESSKPEENTKSEEATKPEGGNQGENNNQGDAGGSKPLSGGAIAGIVIAVVVVVAGAIVLAIFLLRRKNSVSA